MGAIENDSEPGNVWPPSPNISQGSGYAVVDVHSLQWIGKYAAVSLAIAGAVDFVIAVLFILRIYADENPGSFGRVDFLTVYECTKPFISVVYSISAVFSAVWFYLCFSNVVKSGRRALKSTILLRMPIINLVTGYGPFRQLWSESLMRSQRSIDNNRAQNAGISFLVLWVLFLADALTGLMFDALHPSHLSGNDYNIVFSALSVLSNVVDGIADIAWIPCILFVTKAQLSWPETTEVA